MRSKLVGFCTLCSLVITGSAALAQEIPSAQEILDFRTLAQQGNSDAEFSLGLLYSTGRGVNQDNKEALKWYTLAAEQENARAQSALGLMYANGEGVPRNFHTANVWLSKAALQDEPVAEVSLVSSYLYGIGMKKDYVRAYMYALLALNHKAEDYQTPYAKDIMDLVRMHKRELEGSMTPEQIAEAKNLADHWSSGPGQ